jgi:hypothetical protein
MSRRIAGLAVAVALVVASSPGAARAGAPAPPARSGPGAAGLGDPYFPLDGNGGYDVRHYLLDVRYAPPTDVLTGVATIRARATHDLSGFNLDLVGLHVRSIAVDGRPATWSRDGGELTVTPARGLRDGRRFTAVVRYDGVPQTIVEEGLGTSGFMHTDDGTLVAGEPHVAATWYPVDDHPLDKASYTFRITVPEGLEAVANGVLERKRTRDGLTTWVWDAPEPMASYLATATIGEFDLRAYRKGAVRYWDAIDPDLLTRAAPRTGERFAISQVADASYKRLARTVGVPAEGARLSFWVRRDTERSEDFMFVEAHPVGSEHWTTLRDAHGHTRAETGRACRDRLGIHPFLAHYLTADPDGTCSPTGTTGEWWAASGASDGYEQWSVDLSPYAGADVEISLTSAGDDAVQFSGVFVDDVVVSGGPGSTSFEDDGDTLDGWTVPGAPEGSPPNANTWIAGPAADAPAPVGELAARSLRRQPEIIGFLSGIFGPYPFSAAGGIVDDTDELGFALENQTRPIYAKDFFGDRSPGGADAVVVHELAHQWVGDSLALAAWPHVWLNEGFATYAEWLWSEREGRESAQELFASAAAAPADDPLWAVTVGDPGPAALFDDAVYVRGAMTLHALRRTVGDADFFTILRAWAGEHAGGNVTTAQFAALAERISGQELDAFFAAWLFTAGKPDGIGPAARAAGGRPRTARASASHPRTRTDRRRCSCRRAFRSPAGDGARRPGPRRPAGRPPS